MKRVILIGYSIVTFTGALAAIKVAFLGLDPVTWRVPAHEVSERGTGVGRFEALHVREERRALHASPQLHSFLGRAQSEDTKRSECTTKLSLLFLWCTGRSLRTHTCAIIFRGCID